MSRAAVLAIDLGAESGRAVLVTLEPGVPRPLAQREVHRFTNRPLRLPDGLHWDVAGLLREVVEGIRRGVAAAAAEGLPLRSVGVDAWGVDFALLGASGELLGLPRCHRDPLAQEAFESVLADLGRERLYACTGIQFLPFNTVYQLVGLQRREPELLAAARHLLFVPDLLHYWLTGRRAVEATIASTSQLADPRSGDWAWELIDELGLPRRVFGPLSPPGTALGPLLPDLRAATGAGEDLQVVLPASHDTASAVLAVPAQRETPWAFLSSGTWSLLGLERTAPILDAAACEASFTNEWGAGGTFRFLKNITGLWLVQECRRAFAAEGLDLGYPELTRLAAEAGPSATQLDVTDPVFLTPGDMPERIREQARRQGQPVPDGPGAIVRCCLEGLARAYAETLATAERLAGGPRCAVLHVVGGGSRNTLLNELTAAAIGRAVVAGPVEAAALGNALSQMRSDDHLER